MFTSSLYLENARKILQGTVQTQKGKFPFVNVFFSFLQFLHILEFAFTLCNLIDLFLTASQVH